MAKILSETERRLQKKLIPLNIFVCLLALVAAVSLIITPFIKLDVGKILGSETVMQFAEEKLEEMVKDSGEVPEGQVDYTPVISSVVKNVMSEAEGDVSLTTLTLFKAAIAKGSKSEVLMEQVFYTGLVDKLIDSVAEAVANVLDTPEGKTVVQEAMVLAITTQVAQNLPENITVNQQKLSELTNTLLTIDGKDRVGAEEVVTQFVNGMDGLFGDGYDIGESKENIKNYVMDLYDDTVTELEGKEQGFSVEAMICVAVSKNTDLGNFNLGELISGMLPKNDEEKPAAAINYTVAEGEEEGEPDLPSEGEEPSPIPPETGSTDGGSALVCTTYPELMDAMGLGKDDVEALKEDLKVALRGMVDDYVGGYAQYIDKYWYALFAPLLFVLPWVILFLFSFFHMLAKNKRFMMWYVKLYSWLPCIACGVVPLIAPLVAPKLFALLGIELAAEQSSLILTVLGGISTLTWISGGCYLMLWLVSVFWAFPIKHKIRKERKLCKQAMKNGTYSYDNYSDYGSYGGKGKKKGKKGKRGDVYAPDAYGSSYGSGYGYGDSYGSDYGSGYGGGYGSSYGGYDDGGFDDDYDYDSFGYPPYDPYGSSYGSIYDDDDDDY